MTGEMNPSLLTGIALTERRFEKSSLFMLKAASSMMGISLSILIGRIG